MVEMKLGMGVLPCHKTSTILLLLHDDLLGWTLLVLHLHHHHHHQPAVSRNLYLPLSFPIISDSTSFLETGHQGVGRQRYTRLINIPEVPDYSPPGVAPAEDILPHSYIIQPHRKEVSTSARYDAIG